LANTARSLETGARKAADAGYTRCPWRGKFGKQFVSTRSGLQLGFEAQHLFLGEGTTLGVGREAIRSPGNVSQVGGDGSDVRGPLI
jgi:hypothetical protein